MAKVLFPNHLYDESSPSCPDGALFNPHLAGGCTSECHAHAEVWAAHGLLGIGRWSANSALQERPSAPRNSPCWGW